MGLEALKAAVADANVGVVAIRPRRPLVRQRQRRRPRGGRARDQAQRRALRGAAAGRHGGGRARRWARGRGRPATVDRHPDASAPVPRAARHRRHRPHPLARGVGVGAGRPRDPVPRHDPRRPLPGLGPGEPVAQRRRDRRRVRVGDGAGDRRDPRGARAGRRTTRPPCSVRAHGPFCWGPSPAGAVETAIALEAVAAMATRTLLIDAAIGEIPDELLARHFDRKHGADRVLRPAGSRGRRGGVRRRHRGRIAMRYAIGIDFGTESGRAVLVDVATGAELGTAVHAYANGVIDRRLPAPDEDVVLDADWALQDPADYVATVRATVPAVLAATGVDPADVVGIGIDFTSCTMLPTTADGTPLCQVPELRREPHAWVKLWKHHAAQPEADRINALAASRGEAWLPRYGGRISSEWFISKSLQILDEAPRGLPRRRSPDRGGRLDRVAADRDRDAQRVHRGLQGVVVEARRLPGRRVLRGAPARARVHRRRQAVAPDRRAGHDGRWAVGRGGRAGPGCGPGRPSRSPTSTPTSRCRRSA